MFRNGFGALYVNPSQQVNWQCSSLIKMMNPKSLSQSGIWKSSGKTSMHLSSISIPIPSRLIMVCLSESCSQGSKVWASKCGTILPFLPQHTVPPPWTWKPLPDWQSAGRKQRTWEMWTVMARKKAAASWQYLRYTWRWNLHAYPFIHRIYRI